MKQVCVAVWLLLMTVGACAQTESEYGRRKTVSVFVSYSNNSSHVLIGQERNRKLAGAGVGYSRRLGGNRLFDFTYEAELRPVTFIRDPVVDGVATYTVRTNPAGGVIDVPAGPQPFSGPTTADCSSGTTLTNGISKNGVLYTQTVTQTCGERWTYTGGVSPLGVRLQFLRRSRVQPFVVGNGGFLAAARDLPVNYSAGFNFTFEMGGGIELFHDHARSIAMDVRLHHLSNAYRGYYNPGIDSVVSRLSYRFGR